MILLIIGCKNNETLSFRIDVYHENENFHEEVLSFFEKSNYTNKYIAGAKSPKIIESYTSEGKLLNQSSVYNSDTANIGLLSLYPNTRQALTFMLKNQTYDYSLLEKEFLNGYCILVKDHMKKGTKIKFIDYKPTKDMPACFELLHSGLAIYKNVNNKSK